MLHTKRQEKEEKVTEQLNNLKILTKIFFYFIVLLIFYSCLCCKKCIYIQCHIPLLLYINTAMCRKIKTEEEETHRGRTKVIFFYICAIAWQWNDESPHIFHSSWRLPGKWDAADTAFCVCECFIAPSWMFIILILFYFYFFSFIVTSLGFLSQRWRFFFLEIVLFFRYAVDVVDVNVVWVSLGEIAAFLLETWFYVTVS